MLPFKLRPAPCGRGRRFNTTSWHRSYTVPSGVGGQEAARPSRHRDPQRPTILVFQLPHPTLGSRISSQGCGVESPIGEPEQPEGAAREDLVDLR